jgi:hypothetical protein
MFTGNNSSRVSPAAALVMQYLGCLITVRAEVVPGKGLCGRYEIVAASSETVCAFENFGIVEISSDIIEAPDLQTVCEWAKCEIDFLLEEPF